jgi:hypothetical protein
VSAQLLRHYVLTVGRTAVTKGKGVREVRALQVPIDVALGRLERVPITELRRLRNDIDSELAARPEDS